MKTLGVKRIISLFLLTVGSIAVNGQQYNAEVPGDNFSLEGALELFKKSESPEAFEKLLNSSNSKVNNLDLNEDGYIDYIRVIDRNEGNVHAFILQAVISERESQDVAVIELEKLANGKAVLQITGDADIYGIETIIEPTDEVRINAGATTTRRVVNVWAWPSVQYVYSPHYSSVWVSPWHYSYRPVWYRPWRPIAYHVYSPYWRSYQPYYSVCYTHRVTYAHQLYGPYRTTSVVVYNRHHDKIRDYRSTRHDYDDKGHYKYGDNGKRDVRGESRYSDSRSTGRQHESRNDAYTDRKSSDSRTSYRTNSRSSSERGSDQATRRTYTKRDYSSNSPTARRSESTPVNRSTYSYQDGRADSGQRSSTESRTRETSNSRPNYSNTSRSREQKKAAPSYEKKRSPEPPSGQGNGQRRSKGSDDKSKKGGQ